MKTSFLIRPASGRLQLRWWARLLVVPVLTAGVLVASQTVSDLTVTNGRIQMISDAGQIATASNTTAVTVEAQSGGALILWSGTQVDLKPGFHAASGSFFWAAVDRDMNGYSDVEEMTDTDGDGMPDAWEADHGLNMLDPGDASADRNGDGQSNLEEYQASTSAVNETALPSGYQLVLRIPAGKYYGVNTGTWEIAGVASPY